jgi:hypothetical protein
MHHTCSNDSPISPPVGSIHKERVCLLVFAYSCTWSLVTTEGAAPPPRRMHAMVQVTGGRQGFLSTFNHRTALEGCLGSQNSQS